MNLQARNLTALRADKSASWARKWPVVLIRDELMVHLFSGPGLPDWPEIWGLEHCGISAATYWFLECWPDSIKSQECLGGFRKY